MFPLVLALVACTPDLPEKKDTAEPSGGPYAVVSTTDFSVGALALVDLESGAVSDMVTATSGDPSVVADGGWLFQVNGYNTDTIRVYEPGDLFAPLAEFSTGAGSNPHDVEVCGGKLFVSLYETTRIGIYDPASGSEIGEISLADWSDSDGIPEVSNLVELDGVLFAALQHFDRDDGWSSTEGEVIEIDCDSGTVVQTWQVGPSPRITAHPTRPDALLVLTGVYWQADGGIWVLDTEEGLEEEAVLLESEAQVDLVSLATSAGGHLVLTAAGFESGSSLVCLDLSTGIWSSAAATEAWYARIHASPSGEAWVSVRPTPDDPNHGLLVFDIDACAPRNDLSRFTLTLPPYGVAFPG
jgi:dipeptidyl aminopeptidase/acylaminoacyl peptidase